MRSKEEKSKITRNNEINKSKSPWLHIIIIGHTRDKIYIYFVNFFLVYGILCMINLNFILL